MFKAILTSASENGALNIWIMNTKSKQILPTLQVHENNNYITPISKKMRQIGSRNIKTNGIDLTTYIKFLGERKRDCGDSGIGTGGGRRLTLNIL